MRKPRLLAGLALLLVAAAAGWYFASPWLTLRAMASAAKANDVDRLSAYIDYDSLRRDLKAQLAARLEAETKPAKGLAGKIALVAGRAAIGPALDAAVSPQALKATFALIGGVREGGAGGRGKAPLPTIDRQGLGRFKVANPATPGTTLVFERRGLGWRLAGIDLGPGAPPRRSGAGR